MGKGNISLKMKRKNGRRKKKLRDKNGASVAIESPQNKEWKCPKCRSKNDSDHKSCWWCDYRRR